MHNTLWKALPWVFTDEGRVYVERDNEPGGAGNFGVSLDTFRQYRAKHGLKKTTKADLKKMTEAQAGAVYREMFWDVMRCDELRLGVDYCLFDLSINPGANGALRILQSALHLPKTGYRITPAIIAAANKAEPKKLINMLCDAFMPFKELSIADNPKNARYRKGWNNRNEKRRKRALALVK